MRCPIETQENAELLLAYCARRLDLETAAVLERHMESCPACNAFHAAQKTVWDALDAWEATPVSDDFDRRLYARIETEGISLWRRLLRPLQPLLARQAIPLATAACLLVMAGILLEHPGSVTLPNQSPHMETVQAEQVERTLDDLELLSEFQLTPPPDNRTM